MIPPTRQTFACKILGARAGRVVAPGEALTLPPDVVLSHDDAAAVARRLLPDATVCDPDQHVIVLDRCAPAADEAAARAHCDARTFAKRHGIENFFDINTGGAHQILPEQGFALPGRLIVGSDRRTTTCGALGAYAVGMGPDAVASAMATGRVTLRVPETARVTVRGRLAPGVSPFDLALRLLADLAAAGVQALAVEFAGPGLDDVPVPGRLTLCGMAAGAGVALAYVEPDAITLAWLNGRARGNFEIVRGDPEAPRARELSCDADSLSPLVARAGGTEARELAQVAGAPVDQVMIGGCTGGRLDDLRAAAAVLRDRRVAAATRLLVLPASQEVVRGAARDGTLIALLDAGAVLLNPGCGPCGGRRLGLLAPGEMGLTTSVPLDDGTTRGGDDALWLASPPTCAASAVAGRLADVREMLDEDALRFAEARS